MKIDKISSNTYRIRKMIKGKTYSVTFDHKPNQQEILKAMSDTIEKPKCAETDAFINYANKYIENKSNTLKSSTKRGYKIIIRNMPDWLAKKKLRDITEEDIEIYVNDMAAELSPKTVKNRYSFVVSVIQKYNKSFSCNVKLPLIPDSEPFIPSISQIQAIAQALEGTEYEIPIKLACSGLRQSEIGGLTIDDVYDGKVHIHQSLVQGEDNQWIIEKTNKTKKSTREIEISEDLYNKIVSQGYIYKGSMHTIFDVLNRTCKKLGIPHLSIHKLRHFSVSYCHEIGVPEQTILDIHGYETANIMKSVYRHSLEREKAEHRLSLKMNQLFTDKKTDKITDKITDKKQ